MFCVAGVGEGMVSAQEDHTETAMTAMVSTTTMSCSRFLCNPHPLDRAGVKLGIWETSSKDLKHSSFKGVEVTVISLSLSMDIYLQTRYSYLLSESHLSFK